MTSSETLCPNQTPSEVRGQHFGTYIVGARLSGKCSSGHPAGGSTSGYQARGVTGPTSCPHSGEGPVLSVPSSLQRRHWHRQGGGREHCTYVCLWAQSKQTGRPAQTCGESGRPAAGSEEHRMGRGGGPGFWAGTDRPHPDRPGGRHYKDSVIGSGIGLTVEVRPEINLKPVELDSSPLL